MKVPQGLVEICAGVAIGFALGHLGAGRSLNGTTSGRERVEQNTFPASPEVGVRMGPSAFAGGGGAGGVSTNAAVPPLDPFLTHLGLTQEDLNRTTELNLACRKGDYVLQNERPTRRKFLEHDFADIVMREKENRAAEYDGIFGELGVAPEVAEQLKNHAGKIHQAALETEVSIGQLLTARQDYDNRLREVLDTDGYNRYRQFEEDRPAAREVELFKKFVESQGLVFETEQQASLMAVIRRAQAYSSEGWIGPYDRVHMPQLGCENVLAAVENERARISDRANQLLSEAAQAQVPEGYQHLLASYYMEIVSEKQKAINSLNQQVSSASPTLRPTLRH